MYLVRCATHLCFVKLFFVLFCISARTSENDSLKVCQEEITDQVKWPTTPVNSCSTSEPLCINNFEITEKCCVSNETWWKNNPTCCDIQEHIKSPCPKDSFQKDNICIFVRETTYPPRCPYEEILAFDSYIQYIDAIFPIWLPVEKDKGELYGEGLFYWTENSQNYKTSYAKQFYYQDLLQDKNCLLFHNESYTEAVACTETHPAICAYEILSQKTKSFCSQVFTSSCKQSDYSTKSKCFCQINRTEKEINRIELLIPYQNLLYTSLDEICYIGLEKKGDSYIWSNSNLPITYTYWSTNSKFGKEYLFGAMSSDGWLLKSTEDEESCTLIQKSLPDVVNEISLTLSLKNETTLYAVSEELPYWKQDEISSDPMIFCFTDASSDTIIQKIDTQINVVQNKLEVEFSLLNDAPGNYWCEGFLYPELNVKKSNIFHKESTNREYVAIVTTSYIPVIENPLTDGFIKQKYDLFIKTLATLEKDFTRLINVFPRIYKIVKVDEAASTITLNFHLTSNTSMNEVEVYSGLLPAMNVLRESSAFFSNNFYMTTFCIGFQTNNEQDATITWPLTKVNEVAYKPREEWCLDKDGSVITMSCKGNFIDGASWVPMEKQCSSLENVQLHLILNQVLKINNPSNYMSLVRELIQKKSEEFQTVHINLIAQFLKQISEGEPINSSNIEDFANLVDEVININEDLLKQSQIDHNSTDVILYCIHKILEKSNFHDAIIRSSFSIITLLIDEFYSNSIVWTRSANGYDIEYVNLTESDLELNNFSADFDSSLIFDRNLLNEIINVNNNRIIIIAYFKGTLFNEDYLQQHASTVFSTIFPNMPSWNTSDLDNLIITMYNANNIENPDMLNCSYWSKDSENTKGYWYHNSKSKSLDSKLLCNFKKITNVGLISVDNVTARLEALVEDKQIDCSEILRRIKILLSSLSTQFQSTDISLTSNLLLRCQSDVESVSDILDQLLDLPANALFSSETVLLDTFYTVFTGINNNNIEIIKKNFAVSITDIHDVQGFHLEKCDNYCNIVLDRGKSTEKEYEISFTMSEELINQLIASLLSKIIFILFSNDALFSNKNYYKLRESSKVVGLMIDVPDLFKLNGDISIVYNIENDSINHTCEFWMMDHWDPTLPVNFLGMNQYNCKYWDFGYYTLRYNYVNVTALIEETLNENLDTYETLVILGNITQVYTKIFKAVDIDLIASYLSQIKDADNNIFDKYAFVISNIMELNRQVVIESERKYSSTNRIINSITNIAGQVDGPINVCESNLIVIKTQTIAKISGLIINDIGGPCNFNPILDVIPVNFNTGIILKSDQIIPETIMFTAFYTNSIFIEKMDKKNTSVIFGVHILGYDSVISKDITVYFDGANIKSEYLGCVYWTGSQTTTGWWELSGRASPSFTCNHFKQGYFTLWEANETTFNISAMLEDVYNSEDSTEKKLERLESISTYHENFKSIDIMLLSQCFLQLLQLDKINHDSITVLKRIGINYFKIPSSIKYESQSLHNATSSILDFIYNNGLSLDSNATIELESFFQIIKCDIDKNFYLITMPNNKLHCFHVPFEPEESNITVVYMQLSSINSAISVSIFDENDLFVDKKSTATSKIIGIYVSNPTNDISIDVFFNQTTVNNPNFACGFWTFVPNENGKWTYFPTNKEPTRTVCTVSNVKAVQHIALVDLTFTRVLKDIFRGPYTYFEKISAVSKLMPDFQNQFEPKNVDQIYQILNSTEVFEDIHLTIFVDIINNLMGLKREILASAQKHYNTTENLLNCIDSLIRGYKGEIFLNHNNFGLIIKSHVSGIVFKHSNKLSYTIKHILYDNQDNRKPDSLDTSLIIDNPTEIPNKLYISVYLNNALFNGKYEPSIRDEAIIVGIGVSDPTVKTSLKTYFANYEDQMNICAYWNHNDAQTGFWETITKCPCENRMNVKYFALLEEYNVTSDLQDIFVANISLDEKLVNVIGIVQNSTDILKPYDIYLISKIVGLLRECLNTTKYQVDLTSQIMSELFNVNRAILHESQLVYAATDSLLYTTDQVIMSCVDDLEEPMIHTNFTIVKTDVKDGNITSLVFNDCTTTACNISFLNNENISEILTNTTFKTALVFSSELIEQIKVNDGPVNLMITLYFHDNYFNENPSRNMDTSHVMGIILEGLNTDLQGKIYLMYNIEKINVYDDRKCAFWKYQVADSPSHGFWQNDGMPTSDSGFIICEYSHLTHFVLLLAGSGSIIEQLNNSHILDIITNINSVLSLFGLFGILLTAVLFDRWRNNTGNQILINFSIAISIKNVMLYISEGIYTESDKSMACTITGGILHYSILSEFCWMLIIAILQFKRFVEVLGGPLKYVLLKACICGWVFPALPVFLIIIIDVNNYNKSEVGLCYPSGFGLYLGVWLPLVVIISINFIIFLFILYNVFHKKTEYRDQVNHDIIFQWRLAILLFSMLGLTWTLGFLSLIFGSSIFAVLFCFLATLQGFVMFMFFIVFNKNARYLYVQCFSSWMYSKGYKQGIK